MRPNQLRASHAIKALYITMISLVVTSTIAYILLYMMSNDAMNFDNMNDYLNKIQTYSLLAGIVGLIHTGIYITCIVLFIKWFRRAYFNLHNLAPHSRLKYSEGWAAGAWFIPIFNLFGPFQIATDLFYESEKLLVDNNLMEKQPKFHQVKGWWWGLWVAAGVVERVSSLFENSQPLKVQGIAGVIALILTIGAGFLAIQMIKNYSPMEELLKQVPYKDGLMPEMSITNDDLLDSGI